MRTVLLLLTLGVVLAMLKAVLTVLALALLLALIVSFAIRPRETLLFLGVLLLCGLASARPTAFIIALGVLGVVVVVVVVAGARRKPPSQLSLRDGCGDH